MRAALLAVVLVMTSAPAIAADLTLTRVMLSSAGVGYFEYETEVDGAATLGLDVKLDQVDDVLASLVVFDSAGGVGTVELPGRDADRAVFGKLPFGPEALQSPVAYLNALQGVEVTIQGTQPLSGRIIHAELENETVSRSSAPGTSQVSLAAPSPPRTRVTILNAEGLHQFVLEDVTSVQVADPALRARIANAVEAVQREASQSTRHLTLHSVGQGKRIMRVGYVAVAPLWKASYRLVLPAKPGDPARLQGWAVRENATGDDWANVALSLQYGNPVTFHQAIYQSYFVQRPDVPVEVLGRLLPDIDTRARVAQAQSFGSTTPNGFMKTETRSVGAASAASLASPVPAPAPMGMPASASMAAAAEPAASAEGTEETVFELASPVALAAGHTANVPILDRQVPAERIDLATILQPHPLSAIRLVNDTATSLPAGALTLYDTSGQAAFAGDARLGGLPAGETRLLSFAQDLRTTVETAVSPRPQTLVSLTISDGVMHVVQRQREAIQVTVTAPAHEARKVLVQIPMFAGTTLSFDGGAIAGTEQTATIWRVPLTLRPGEVRKLTAYRDYQMANTTTVLDADDNHVLALVNEPGSTPEARAALQHLLALRRDEAEKRAIVAQIAEQRSAAEADEDRIRKNLAVVSANDPLGARLRRALDADETQIEKISQQAAHAIAEAEAAHRAMADAVGSLRL